MVQTSNSKDFQNAFGLEFIQENIHVYVKEKNKHS